MPTTTTTIEYRLLPHFTIDHCLPLPYHQPPSTTMIINHYWSPLLPLIIGHPLLCYHPLPTPIIFIINHHLSSSSTIGHQYHHPFLLTPPTNTIIINDHSPLHSTSNNRPLLSFHHQSLHATIHFYLSLSTIIFHH